MKTLHYNYKFLSKCKTKSVIYVFISLQNNCLQKRPKRDIKVSYFYRDFYEMPAHYEKHRAGQGAVRVRWHLNAIIPRTFMTSGLNNAT